MKSACVEQAPLPNSYYAKKILQLRISTKLKEFLHYKNILTHKFLNFANWRGGKGEWRSVVNISSSCLFIHLFDECLGLQLVRHENIFSEHLVYISKKFALDGFQPTFSELYFFLKEKVWKDETHPNLSTELSCV